MKIKILFQFILSIAIWFFIFLLIQEAFDVEWLVVNKYWLISILASFFIGAHTGIFLLKKAVMRGKK